MNSIIKNLSDCFEELESASKDSIKAEKRLMLARQKMRQAKQELYFLEEEILELRVPLDGIKKNTPIKECVLPSDMAIKGGLNQ